MKSLAPYPTPSSKQEKLVHRVELFANTLKKVSHGIKLGFYPITYFPSKHHMKNVKREWEQRAQAVPKDELIQPQEKAVYVANSTQAMDQNFFYILKNGRIWFKPIAAPENSAWLLFGPDGLAPNSVKLTSISSDGRNLIAIGNDTVNYVHTDCIDFFVTDNSWHIRNIKLDWTDRWFAIPVINSITGLFHDNHLKLPKDWRSFAISQKGPETGYYTDMSGKNQPEFLVGVTTLYVLTNDGRIYFADPWLGNGFHNEITAPEDGQFVAENMAVSASTIFLLRRDETGTHMYTRFADFDSTGGDPLLPTTYNPDNKTPLVRRIPGEDWTKQPEILLEKQARLTSCISILQTGRGQSNRQLRVEGTNANGEPGYYFKAIYENKWHFELTPGQTLDFTSPTKISNPPSPPVDLNGQIFTKKSITPVKLVALKKFLSHGLNERGLHTVIELTLNNGRKLTLPLYARRRFAHLFGLRNNLPYWQLVLPKEYELDNDIEVQTALKALFKNKKHISVTVNEFENGDIEIFNKHRRFTFEFKAATPNIVNTIAPPSNPSCTNHFYANDNSGLSMFSNYNNSRITEQPDLERNHLTQQKPKIFF